MHCTLEEKVEIRRLELDVKAYITVKVYNWPMLLQYKSGMHKCVYVLDQELRRHIELRSKNAIAIPSVSTASMLKWPSSHLQSILARHPSLQGLIIPMENLWQGFLLTIIANNIPYMHSIQKLYLRKLSNVAVHGTSMFSATSSAKAHH